METPISRPREEQKAPDNSCLSRFLNFFKAKIYAVLGVERMVGAARIETCQKVRKEFEDYVAPNIHQNTVVQLEAAQRKIEESKIVQEGITAQLEVAQKEIKELKEATKLAVAQLEVAQSEAKELRTQLESAQKEIEKLRATTNQAVQKAKDEFRNHVAPNVHTQLEVRRNIEAIRMRVYERFIPLAEKNEDNRFSWIHKDKGIFLIADGFSGMSGKLASRTAVDGVGKSLVDKILYGDNNHLHEFFKEQIIAVNSKLTKGSARTTFDGLVVDYSIGLAYGYHIGDSRIYSVDKKGKLKQRTTDHRGSGSGRVPPSMCLGVPFGKDNKLEDIVIKLDDRRQDEGILGIYMATDGGIDTVTDEERNAIFRGLFDENKDPDQILDELIELAFCPKEVLTRRIGLNIGLDNWEYLANRFKLSFKTQRGDFDKTACENYFRENIDTETGRGMRRELAMILGLLDDTVMYFVQLNRIAIGGTKITPRKLGFPATTKKPRKK